MSRLDIITQSISTVDLLPRIIFINTSFSYVDYLKYKYKGETGTVHTFTLNP